MDPFKKEFKRYKQKEPPPDLSNVIDFKAPEKWKDKVYSVVLSLNCSESNNLNGFGLRSCREWKVYSLKDHPGFLFITNPFHRGAQWDLARKCLQVYSCKPNVSNLDAHIEVKDSIWDTSLNSGYDKSSLLYKLRWVTFGYHYDWNTKTYNQEAVSDFPPDLSSLFIAIAETMGFEDFRPEAGIVNYYHLDSTLGGHTDHSEFDLTAPLFSLSLGQSAIFLLGGKTRDVAPIAMYMRSGDIVVMAGNSRLAYHAVPRILAPNEEQTLPLCLEPYYNSSPENHPQQKEALVLPGEKCEGRKCNQVCSEETETRCKRTKYDTEEVCFDCGKDSSRRSLAGITERELILHYLSMSRININIRQVLASGQTFPS